MSHQFVLLLNANYQPIKKVSWRRAMELLMEEKADMVVGYVGELVRSVTLSFERPAVIRLRQFVAQKGKVRFNRQNVLARDSYTCQYCGVVPMRAKRPDLEQLTIDHVIPRAQSRNGKVFLPWSRETVT